MEGACNRIFLASASCGDEVLSHPGPQLRVRAPLLSSLPLCLPQASLALSGLCWSRCSVTGLPVAGACAAPLGF